MVRSKRASRRSRFSRRLRSYRTRRSNRTRRKYSRRRRNRRQRGGARSRHSTEALALLKQARIPDSVYSHIAEKTSSEDGEQYNGGDNKAGQLWYTTLNDLVKNPPDARAAAGMSRNDLIEKTRFFYNLFFNPHGEDRSGVQKNKPKVTDSRSSSSYSNSLD